MTYDLYHWRGGRDRWEASPHRVTYLLGEVVDDGDGLAWAELCDLVRRLVGMGFETRDLFAVDHASGQRRVCVGPCT